MDHSGVVAKSHESIKSRAEELDVPLSWTLQCRREYLRGIVEENKALVVEYVKELGRANKLGRAFLLDWMSNARERIKKARFDLSRLKPQAQSKRDGVSEEEIERAREYPIAQLLPNRVSRGMTLCPFHPDRNPSMSVKDNRGHCFSCNKNWNAIDLVMELRGLQFVDAVTYLNQ